MAFSSKLKIITIGDVVGNCGVEAVEKLLRKIKVEYKADVVIVNGENASERGGIDRQAAERLFDAGADVITGGNHSLRNKDIHSLLEENTRLLRPQNYGGTSPGCGNVIIDTAAGRLLVINVAGQLFMDVADSPFSTTEHLLNQLQGKYDVVIADFHGEATSEKAAFARYFDSSERIQAVFGTHTHVQTSDIRILPNGCGFITDVGMCGPDESILGVRCEAVINRMVHRKPERFITANGQSRLDGAYFTIDFITKKTTEVGSFSILNN